MKKSFASLGLGSLSVYILLSRFATPKFQLFYYVFLIGGIILLLLGFFKDSNKKSRN